MKDNMNISILRKEIDDIDDCLIKLLEKRASIIKEVALYKSKNKMDVFDSNREEEIINKIKETTAEENVDYCLFVFENILHGSKKIQTEIMKSVEE